MEILITGGAGFIGSHILAQLQGRRDMDVVVFDNLSSGSKEHVPAGMELVEGDVCDEAAVDALFADHHFDAVIHLAAQTMVPTSVEQPVLDCRINLEGVLHVLEACRIHGTRHILFSSSAAVYGDNLHIPLKETERLVPTSPYGITKMTTEHYLLVYHELYGMDATVFRFANVYGERQGEKGEGGVVSIFCKLLSQRQGITVFGDGNQTRDFVYAGDIAAAVGVKNTTTGDTFCDEKHPIILESMEFPEPVIRVAIEPKTKAGQEKMGIALMKLAEEDPTFKTYTDEETGQTIIAGMGELHLEIIVDRLLREFKVEANVGAPQVAYRETIRKEANQETKYARQSGGKGQYGHVKIKIEPNEPGKGYEFVNAIVGGAIPKEYIPAIDNGIQGAMKSGVLAGYPVVDVKVTLWDGSYHEVDSSEMAFSIAGSMAFKDAMRKADPIITEPIMKVAVIVPDEYLGDVIGDLNSRRGQIQGMEAMAGTQRVNAFVPLAQMFGYATDLRSKTQGRGQYSMEPDEYQQVPKSVADKIMAERAHKV